MVCCVVCVVYHLIGRGERRGVLSRGSVLLERQGRLDLVHVVRNDVGEASG